MMNESPTETALSRAIIRWSLSRATQIADTPASIVYKVEQNGQQPAALKILKPVAGEEEKRGAAMLSWYSGDGAVTVFDVADEAIFMEWLDGPTLGEPARNGRDDEATEAFGHVVQLLHKPRDTTPEGLIPLRQRFQSLFDADSRIWPPTARDLYARSVGIALALFDRPSVAMPLRGDLHHDNILSSARGWLAIDPKGLLGDPAYDVANAFLNPVDVTKLAASATRIAHLADSFSGRLGFNRKRVIAWACAHAALSACQELEAGRPITLTLAVLPLLLAAHDLS
jgi:streptomycin 6-kinase